MTPSRFEPAAASTLLHLMWLASPALPVGGFSYSEGLEAAVEAGCVKGEADATRWLADQLELVLGRAELPLLLSAHAAWQAGDGARIEALARWLHESRESAEQRQQAEQMGRSLLEWLRHGAWAADARIEALGALPVVPGWPLAFALGGVLAGATAEDTALAFAFGWAENMVQAAMRAVPLGQLAAQRILTALAAVIPAAVEAAATRAAAGDIERQSFAPMLAVLSAEHEVQYSRLFRS